jgi:hypothetical protein
MTATYRELIAVQRQFLDTIVEITREEAAQATTREGIGEAYFTGIVLLISERENWRVDRQGFEVLA